MKSHLQTGLVFAFGFAAILLAYAIPAASHADQMVAVQTRQLLPPNGTSCTTLTVTSITPYVYGGALNSFDVTIDNASYVALIGTVGNEAIGFQYMTRDIMADGKLRIHVDVPIHLSNSGVITISLLSSQGGITCASTISFGIAGIQSGAAVGTTRGSNGHVGGTGTTKPVNTGVGKTPTVTKATSSATTTVTGTAPVVNASLQNALNKACMATGALQLWFILIAAFIVICALTALNEAYLTVRSEYLPAALILAPLLVLLGFWFLASACRGSIWVPILILIAAAAGLLATFRNHKAIAKIIELPPAKTLKK